MARLERQGLSSKKRRTAKVNGPGFGFDGFDSMVSFSIATRISTGADSTIP
jgi:hypothetical protein